jgi:hypothetical protein
MRDQIGHARLMRRALLGTLASLFLVMQAPTTLAALAAPRTIDPRDIALTPADLPAGFTIDQANSGMAPLPDSAGLMLRVDMKRPRTQQAFAEGPVIVQQTIVRIDDATPAETVLASIRDELVADVEMSPTTDGPNDGGTISLKRTDGEVTMYAVGFVKEPMVIVTLWAGAAPVTTFPKLIELAGITSARLDAVLAQP